MLKYLGLFGLILALADSASAGVLLGAYRFETSGAPAAFTGWENTDPGNSKPTYGGYLSATSFANAGVNGSYGINGAAATNSTGTAFNAWRTQSNINNTAYENSANFQTPTIRRNTFSVSAVAGAFTNDFIKLTSIKFDLARANGSDGFGNEIYAAIDYSIGSGTWVRLGEANTGTLNQRVFANNEFTFATPIIFDSSTTQALNFRVYYKKTSGTTLPVTTQAWLDNIELHGVYSVPEPSSIALVGCLCTGFYLKRRKK